MRPHHTSRSRYRLRVPLLALTVAMIGVACSPPGVDNVADGADTTDADADDTASSDGKELTIAIPEEFSTLGSDWGYQPQTGLLLNNIHEPLVDRDPITNDLIPALATKWELVDDNTWHFTIREGVTFHDGSELNAEAVAFGINWTFDEANNFVIRGLLSIIPEAEAIAEYVVKITTSKPKPTLPARLTTVGIPSMEHILANEDDYQVEPVGTGPYVLAEWIRGSSYTLEPFADWWGADDAAYPGEQHWERVTYLIRPEVSSRIAAVAAGEADFAWGLPADECYAALGELCIISPAPIVTNYRVDPMSEVFNDLRIREAMSLAIDRESIGKTILGGAPAASQMITPSLVDFNPDVAVDPYDPGRARELVKEAAADGVPIDAPLTFYGRLNSFAGDSELLEILVSSWIAIGLENWTAEMLDTPVYNALMVIPAEDVAPDRNLVILLRHTNDVFDLSRSYGFYTCAGALSLTCDERDDMVAAAAIIFNPEERAAAHRAIMAAAHDTFDTDWFVMNEMSLFHGTSSDIAFSGRGDMRLRVKDIPPA